MQPSCCWIAARSRHTFSRMILPSLRAALALTVGVEPLIVMRDVCQLQDDEIPDTLRWVATVVLHAALSDAADAVSGDAKRTPSSAAQAS